MIIDNTYLINEIFIPHAKPSVTGDLTAVPGDMVSFIETYEAEALLKCLGYPLYKQFTDQLDSTQTDGLKTTADAKWDSLLNGTEYIDAVSGKTVYWPGIRRKTGEIYNKSFLAEYVYFHYEKSQDDDRTGVGNVHEKAKNAVVVSKTPKVVAAWRRFVEQVQGTCYEPLFITGGNTNNFTAGYTNIRFGIDWFGQMSKTKSLYTFLKDKATDYPDFEPTHFANQNQFGI